MIKPQEPVSVARQCELLEVSRSTWYRQKNRPLVARELENFRLSRMIDEIYLKCPFYGTRRIQMELNRQGVCVGRSRVRSVMRAMGIQAIYPKRRTSIPNKEHKVYPYLLRKLDVCRPNQVWCADITYLPARQGFYYLVCIMDWYSRRILSWSVSNSLNSKFCIDALSEALSNYPTPDIFNTDQGCQFTAEEFTGLLLKNGIKVSMDGQGRWMDNVMIERLWRSLKTEWYFLHEFNGLFDLEKGLRDYCEFYNFQRGHQSLGKRTPDEMYRLGSDNQAEFGQVA